MAEEIHPHFDSPRRSGFERDIKDLASHLERAQIVFDKGISEEKSLEQFHRRHHAVIEEFISKKIESAPISKAPPAGTFLPKAAVSTSQASVHDIRSALEELVELAFREGIIEAAKVAKKIGPYFTDLLHDTMVREFYEEFVRLGKIKPSD